MANTRHARAREMGSRVMGLARAALMLLPVAAAAAGCLVVWLVGWWVRRRRCVAVVAPKWFLCLFVNSLPFETVLREGGKTTKETIQHSTSTHAGR